MSHEVERRAGLRSAATHLHDLRVIEPLAEDGLDEREHLLQDHHDLGDTDEGMNGK